MEKPLQKKMLHASSGNQTHIPRFLARMRYHHTIETTLPAAQSSNRYLGFTNVGDPIQF